MRQGLICALISGALYGVLPIFGKLGYREGLGTTELLTYRFCIAAVIMALLLAVMDRRILRPTVRTVIKGLVIGFGFYGLQGSLYFHALRYIPASTATLIIYFYPVAVTLLSIAFFRMKVTKGVFASLVLMAGGCSLVFYDAFAKNLNMYGVGLALVSMVGFSLYLILVQFFLRDEHPLRVTFYALLATALFFSLQHNPLDIVTLNPRTLFIVLGLALVPTVLAISLLYRAIERIGSAYTSIFSTLEPIVTVLLAGFILGENIVFIQVVGMFLIIGGIVVPNIENILTRKGMMKSQSS